MKRTFTLEGLLAAFLCLLPQGIMAQEEQWPALPLLDITTKDSIMPTVTILETPEGCIGTGIESEYVEGRMVMTLLGDTLYDSGEYVKGESGLRMKVRGNSSGASLQQKPYKLKLSKKADLLTFDKEKKSKDWALMSLRAWNKGFPGEEGNIIMLTGLAVCRAMDFPWTPRTAPVNVRCNGKYCGLYFLTETVEQSECRVKTEDNGFLIENDAYWWNEGDAYFKSAHLPDYMGFTFKYPDADDLTPTELNAISAYMAEAEEALYSGEGAEAYFDYTSFARWLLVHDILGDNDAAGSNMYLYIESLVRTEPAEETDTEEDSIEEENKENTEEEKIEEGNTEEENIEEGNTEETETEETETENGEEEEMEVPADSSRLQMATPWDFDASFLMSDEEWSLVHTHSVFYYPELLKDEAFIEAYKTLWEEKKGMVYEFVEQYFRTLQDSLGEAITQSMALHRTVYPNEAPNSLDDQIDFVLGRLQARIAAIDVLLERDITSGIDKKVAAAGRKLVRRMDIMGVDYTGTAAKRGIFIEVYDDGSRRKVLK